MKHPPASGDSAASVTTEGEVFASEPQRIEYLPVDIPEPGAYAEVAPGIVWVRIPMPMDLNHINLWLLEDGAGWTLIDSGLGSDMGRETWEKLEVALFKRRPLKRIFITHLHPDHIGLAHWLQQRHRVPVWMSIRGLRLAQLFAREPTPEEASVAQGFMRSHGFTDQQVLSRFFSGKMYRTAVSGIPDVEHSPSDGDEIAIGDGRWQVLETNGHAEGHQCLNNAARRILISGDQILPTISSNVSFGPRSDDMNPLKSYLDSLQRLSLLDKQSLVLPSHGRPFFGLQARASDLITHHRAHLAALEAACVTPKNAFELLPVIFKRRLIGSNWMFAMGEIIAHLEYLAQNGVLERRTVGGGTIHYLRTK